MGPVLSKTVRRFSSKMTKGIMKSHKLRIRKHDIPVRFRPWFLIFTCIIVVVLAFLGFTNFKERLPISDKILHFLCFGFATFVFYFIVDIDEGARRIWFWRYLPLLFTAFCCMFCGGILIEVIQAALPFKRFEWEDVLANLLGSGLGLWVGFILERYYRHRREISRLYRPLSAAVSEFEDDDEEAYGVQLLPTHSIYRSKLKPRLTDVWDEREELFGIGEDEEEESVREASISHPQPQQPRIIISHL